jgi:hypothetical protein
MGLANVILVSRAKSLVCAQESRSLHSCSRALLNSLIPASAETVGGPIPIEEELLSIRWMSRREE